MIQYEYGSRPKKPYDYRTYVRHLAPHLPKEDKVFAYNGSLDWRADREEIPLVLFRNICHWKSPRRFKRVCENNVDEVNRQWRNALQSLGQRPFEDGAIKKAVKQLAVLNGVGERTASALLTAWNPDEFGIMDERVFGALSMQDEHKNYTANDYIAFRNRLFQLKNEFSELPGCALRQIELALWHFDAIQEAGPRKRPD